MAWLVGEATHNATRYTVMIKDGFYQFPASAGIKIGDIIEIGGRSHRVSSLSMFRDEAFIAKVEEIEDGQQAPRRANSKASGKRISDKAKSGLDSTDRESDEHEHSERSSETVSRIITD